MQAVYNELMAATDLSVIAVQMTEVAGSLKSQN